ncbi:MAG: hypothetical protein ACETWM_14020 [Candidatus Lokiarchaeia archaeon]
MKKILVYLLVVLLLCLGLVPVLAGSLCVAASTPTEKITLAPFVHITDSTVNELRYGIGYVDTVVTIDNGVITGTYTNTTENLNTVPSIHELYWISIYGSSQVTINNTTNLSSVYLYVYGSSQLTIINSTLGYVYTYDSSVLNIKDNSTVTTIQAYDNSKVYLSESIITTVVPRLHASVNGNNCTINSLTTEDFSNITITNNSKIVYFAASDFSTGQMTNCNITNFKSLYAANILVDYSNITNTVEYGLVCTGGSLIINGNTITGLENCRNTTTLTNGNYPSTWDLLTVCALASSNVNITNNNTLWAVSGYDSSTVNIENSSIESVVAGYGSSTVNMENTTFWGIVCTDYSNIVYKNSQNTGVRISAYKYSSLNLQNVNSSYSSTIKIYDDASATIKNSNLSPGEFYAVSIYTYDQSTLDVENVNFTGGGPGFRVSGYDSSVIDIVNVKATGTPTSFYSYDLSVMSISSSTITTIGYAIKSTGNMEVINDVIGGSYVITTTWDGVPVSAPYPISIAVVGTHTATITNSTLSYLGVSIVYLHNKANLNTQNSSIGEVNTYDSTTLNAIDTTFEEPLRLYDTSKLSGTNTTFFSDTYMYNQSSAILSNTTAYMFSIYDSASLSCTGNTSAPTTIVDIGAISNYPQMANVVIQNCTVTGAISGVNWIIQAAGLGYPLPLLFFYYASSQNQGFFTLVLAGGILAAIVAVAGAILWWRRRA